MKNWARSKLPMNFVLFLFYIESCCCFQIDRGLRDISDSFDVRNCESIKGVHVEGGRCKCSATGSIVSINTGSIRCIPDENVDRSCASTILAAPNAAIDNIHVTTTLNCAKGRIDETKFWNMNQNGSQYYGYWHRENDVGNYISLTGNGSILLDNKLRLFNGMFLRIKFSCEEHVECRLVKIYGSRIYPIPRFVSTTPNTSVSTTTTITTSTTTMAKVTTIIAASKGSDKPLSLNPADDDKNVVIIIATVASVATLIIIILSICLWRRACGKQKDGQNDTGDSAKQKNNHPGQSTYTETQKSDAYAKFDEYTTITIKDSLKSAGPKPQYSELGLEYQDIKPVYSELSADQTYVDKPFYKMVDEPEGGESPQSSDVIYHTVEEETPTYEENNYYSAVETLPDELSSTTAVYAKVKK